MVSNDTPHRIPPWFILQHSSCLELIISTTTRQPVVRKMNQSPPTPSLIIDLRTVRRNIARLADYAKSRGIAIRPHTKTHKSLRMAKMQLHAGAVGLTVAKAGEALTMADAGNDLLVAYPALDGWRVEQLAGLARNRTVRVG